jgi:cation transport ATPase
MFWIFTGAELTLLTLSLVACLCGFVQLRKLSHSVFRQPYDLDVLLSGVTAVGAYVYAIFSMIAAGASGIWQLRNMVVFVQHALLLLQVSMQGEFLDKTLAANIGICFPL